MSSLRLEVLYSCTSCRQQICVNPRKPQAPGAGSSQVTHQLRPRKRVSSWSVNGAYPHYRWRRIFEIQDNYQTVRFPILFSLPSNQHKLLWQIPRHSLPLAECGWFVVLQGEERELWVLVIELLSGIFDWWVCIVFGAAGDRCEKLGFGLGVYSNTCMFSLCHIFV